MPAYDTLVEVLSVPALVRPLHFIREKIEQHGRPAGTLEIENDEEALALSGLIGVHLVAGQKIALKRLERVFQEETRFRCTLREAIEILRGGPLVTRPEQRAAREAAWQIAHARMLTAARNAPLPDGTRQRLVQWLEADVRELRRRWAKEGDLLPTSVERTIHCLAFLPPAGESRSLAELANAALQTPHALDRDRSLATLFDRAVAAITDSELPSSGAEARDALLATVGVVTDRTSAKIDTYGLLGQRRDLAALADNPLRSFSLREIEGMREGEIFAPGGVVYAVENASVFDWLVSRLMDMSPPVTPVLVCTNGWLNMADRALLRRLFADGVTLYYSGDMDEPGLAIAREVFRTFPRAKPWRMSGADYRAVGERTPRPVDAGMLTDLPQCLSEVASAMLATNAIVYQESLQQVLLADLLNAESMACAHASVSAD